MVAFYHMMVRGPGTDAVRQSQPYLASGEYTGGHARLTWCRSMTPLRPSALSLTLIKTPDIAGLACPRCNHRGLNRCGHDSINCARCSGARGPS